MRIRRTADGDLDVLALSGEFDARSAQAFDDEVAALIGDYRTRIVVDLSGLKFMDSTGLTRLLNTQRTLRPLGGEQVVAAPPGVVQTTIKTAGIDRTVRVFADVDEARKYFADPECAQRLDLDGVVVDEAHIGRTDVEFGFTDDPEVSAIGKLLMIHEDGVLLRYPIDAERAAIDPRKLEGDRRIWLKFRQPILAPDREFSLEARILFSHVANGDAAKYRLVFTRISDGDRAWMREFAGAQDAIRKYGNPPG
ncbi:MAG: STAS domain-containing protein [Planctomycetota bacterium]|jgi:anti-sigma B factor antagonist